MQSRRPMRLLLREHGVCGGTETVNIHLIKEFTQMVERVVWVMPDWRIEYFQQLLPASNRLIYQSTSWPRQARLAHTLEKATRRVLRRKVSPPLMRAAGDGLDGDEIRGKPDDGAAIRLPHIEADDGQVKLVPFVSGQQGRLLPRGLWRSERRRKIPADQPGNIRVGGSARRNEQIAKELARVERHELWPCRQKLCDQAEAF